MRAAANCARGSQPRAAPGLRGYARRHREELSGIQDHCREWRANGPWNPWLHDPKFGKPIWELTKALSFSPSLPKPVREVAILVTGAKFRAAYEIYAHVMVAERRGLSDDKLATIVAGQRPTDLAREEAIAYDVASALVDRGVLPELTYHLAVQTLANTARRSSSIWSGSIASYPSR